MSTSTSAIGRLSGTTFVLQGKFGYGDKDRGRWGALVEAQGGALADELSANTTHLLLPDPASGKTAIKKAESLNKRGATIRVINLADFIKEFQLNQAEVISLIHSDKRELLTRIVHIDVHGGSGHPPPNVTLTEANFDGADLSGVDYAGIALERCSFVGAKLSNTHFHMVVDCNFSRCTGENVAMTEIIRCQFRDAKISKAKFKAHLEGCDFSDAVFESASFSGYFWGSGGKPISSETGAVFNRASLKSARFEGVRFDGVQHAGANFEGANLSDASFNASAYSMKSSVFRNADLSYADLVSRILDSADFSGANLTGANLAQSKLQNAKFDHAELSGCHFAEANVTGVDFSKAKNANLTFKPAVIGAAITEFQNLAMNSGSIDLTFRVARGDGATFKIGVVKYNGPNHHSYLQEHDFYGRVSPTFQASVPLSGNLIRLGTVFGGMKVMFETIEVEQKNAPKTGKELRAIAAAAVAEAFGQPIPGEEELAALTKAHREREKAAAAIAKAAKDALKDAEKKQAEAAVASMVGAVTDLPSFLKAIELRIDPDRIKKATKMLQAERFELFNDITDTHLNGVVKSQTDRDLVYACRIDSDGKFACCTQNLNACGGLRGSLCKHLLVLIVGLVKAGTLDPVTINKWIAQSIAIKPELDKEKMGEIFVRYKGAEAGELDWRPTQTVPEDYYSL